MDLVLVARSMRRSALRARILIRLAQRRRAYPALLAEDCDVTTRDLVRAMHGRLPGYAPGLSPIALRLAKRVGRKRRREYMITPLGDAVVREMRALRGRR